MKMREWIDIIPCVGFFFLKRMAMNETIQIIIDFFLCRIVYLQRLIVSLCECCLGEAICTVEF